MHGKARLRPSHEVHPWSRMGVGGGSHETDQRELFCVTHIQRHFGILAHHARESERRVGVDSCRGPNLASGMRNSKHFPCRPHARRRRSAIHWAGVLGVRASRIRSQSHPHSPDMDSFTLDMSLSGAFHTKKSAAEPAGIPNPNARPSFEILAWEQSRRP